MGYKLLRYRIAAANYRDLRGGHDDRLCELIGKRTAIYMSMNRRPVGNAGKLAFYFVKCTYQTLYGNLHPATDIYMKPHCQNPKQSIISTSPQSYTPQQEINPPASRPACHYANPRTRNPPPKSKYPLSPPPQIQTHSSPTHLLHHTRLHNRPIIPKPPIKHIKQDTKNHRGPI